MASVNRFSQISTPRYNPRSLQELMIAPMYMREQHDNLLNTSATLETEIAKADPLALHSDIVAKEQARLYESVNKQIETLNSEGFNPNSKSNFINLNKDYQRAISPTGLIGKANNAKKTLNNNKQAHIEASIKNGFSMNDAINAWSKHEQKYIDEYKATGEITPIQELGAPKYIDYLDKATILFKDAGFTERDLAGGMISELVTTDPRGQYILNTGGGKITRNNIQGLTKAVEWLNNNVQNPNSEIGQSIAYQMKTPNQVLSEIGNLAEVYIEDSQKNDYSRTITNFKSAKELGINIKGNLAHETTEATNIKRSYDNLSSKLSNINDKKVINIQSPVTASVSNSNAAGFNAIGTTFTNYTTKKEVANFNNSLNEEEKSQYLKLYKGLQETYPQLAAYDPYSTEASSIINEYVKNTGNMLHQDVIITDDIVKEYGNSTGSSSKTRQDVFDDIKKSRNNRMYSINGKEYTFDQLPNDIKQSFIKDEGRFEYSGYLSPKNFRGINKESNKDLYVSPHILTLYDKDGSNPIEILVGRSGGEQTQSDFMADREFNNIYSNTKAQPGIPYRNTRINSTVTYFIDENGEGKYLLKHKDPTKNEASILDEETLQSKIYTLYGVPIED